MKNENRRIPVVTILPIPDQRTLDSRMEQNYGGRVERIVVDGRVNRTHVIQSYTAEVLDNVTVVVFNNDGNEVGLCTITDAAGIIKLTELNETTGPIAKRDYEIVIISQKVPEGKDFTDFNKIAITGYLRIV